MTLIGLIVTLVVVGFLLWLVNTYIPMDPVVRKILTVVVVIVLLLWLLSLLGAVPLLNTPLFRTGVR